MKKVVWENICVEVTFFLLIFRNFAEHLRTTASVN